ncbi:MAG: single-stranded-DNA-specific exonuclease RecJ [Thermogutta sp.]
MKRLWRIAPHRRELIGAVARDLGISAVTAQILVNRGLLDADSARRFLDPQLQALHPPETLPGCDDAAAMLGEDIAAGRRIVVYGDYDADGIAATAILCKCLRLLGADVGYHIPSRLDDGYGLHPDTLRDLVRSGTKTVVTVDCGISAIAEAAVAQELGLRLIISDHHQAGESLPQAAAIVHPRLPGRAAPFDALSGAGTAFKLGWALAKRAGNGERASPALKQFLVEAVGWAAIGTVADVVPLTDENRILVHYGCTRSLPNATAPGLRRLMELAQSGNNNTDSEWLAFQLAPRLNAVGRLGQAALAVELFVTERPERGAELAQYIDELNWRRKSIEQSIYLKAVKQLKDRFDPDGAPAFVLADSDWHQGVIGIVAGRLTEKYHRPTVLIALSKTGSGEGVGSARGVPGLNLYQALSACSHRLRRYGGHELAAGLTIDESQIDAFRHEFCEYVRDRFDLSQHPPELRIDTAFPLSVFTLDVVRELERLAPFGMGNPRPLMCCENVEVEEKRVVGKDSRHVSLALRQHAAKLRGVAFGAAERIDDLVLGRPLDVAFRPKINEYNGRVSVQLEIVDWRLPEER